MTPLHCPVVKSVNCDWFGEFKLFKFSFGTVLSDLAPYSTRLKKTFIERTDLEKSHLMQIWSVSCPYPTSMFKKDYLF